MDGGGLVRGGVEVEDEEADGDVEGFAGDFVLVYLREFLLVVVERRGGRTG